MNRERIPGKVSACRKRWFASFRARPRLFATLAREAGCELYGLDGKLDRTVGQNSQWKEVIAIARE